MIPAESQRHVIRIWIRAERKTIFYIYETGIRPGFVQNGINPGLLALYIDLTFS